MQTRRFRALALASVAAAVLSAVMAGGSATAAAAADTSPLPHNIGAAGMAKLKAEAQAARAEMTKRAQAQPRLSAAAATAECGTEHPNGSGSVVARRFSGADRYSTAVCISQNTWYDKTDTTHDPAFVADAVVLARGDLYPDALAGGPLAAEVEGPLLLTTPTTLLSGVKAEIQRVLAPGGKVFLLGGTGSLSSSVFNTIKSMGYNPVRLSGSDRFQTAMAIANAMPPTSYFFVTTGMNFPDALAAGNAAAAYTLGTKGTDDPRPTVLLFTQDSTMNAATANYIADHASQFNDYMLLTAGGAANTATAKAFGSDAITGHYVGKDRFATAELIAQDTFTDTSTGKLVSPFVGIVDGMNFPDALAGSVPMAKTGSPLLLVAPTSLPSATAQFLRNHAGDVTPTMYTDVFGGTGAVSDSVMIAARTALTPTA